jgi:prenyltransferase beta subunit
MPESGPPVQTTFLPFVCAAVEHRTHHTVSRTVEGIAMRAAEGIAMNKICLASLVCLLCLVPARAQTLDAQAKKQSIQYLLQLQTKEGSFVAETADSKQNAKPTLRATLSAVRALKYLDGKLANKEGCSKFVGDCFDKTAGGFADTPGGKVNVLSTALGLMAVADLGMPAETYQAAGLKYLEDNAKSFDDVRIASAALESFKINKAPKGWMEIVDAEKDPPVSDQPNGRARILASKLVTRIRLGVAPAAGDPVIKELQTAQRSNGGYGKDESLRSDLETTYRVMRGLWMLKVRPASVSDLRNFLSKCRNEDGGYAVVPGDNSSAAGTYYAAIITYWLDQKK